jgi:hypothetical protein
MYDTIIIHKRGTGTYRKATNAKMAELAAGANWNTNELYKVNGKDWKSTVAMFRGRTNGKSAEEAAFNRLLQERKIERADDDYWQIIR